MSWAIYRFKKNIVQLLPIYRNYRDICQLSFALLLHITVDFEWLLQLKLHKTLIFALISCCPEKAYSQIFFFLIVSKKDYSQVIFLDTLRNFCSLGKTFIFFSLSNMLILGWKSCVFYYERIKQIQIIKGSYTKSSDIPQFHRTASKDTKEDDCTKKGNKPSNKWNNEPGYLWKPTQHRLTRTVLRI